MIVLLVEDNENLAVAYKNILEEQPGIRLVEIVTTLNAAIERILQGGISVVLLDLGLPDAMGVEAIRKLQAAAPEMPIVVITGSCEFELSSILAGAQDFIEKGNATGEQVAQRLRLAFERHRVRGLYQPAKQTVGEMRNTIDRLGTLLDPSKGEVQKMKESEEARLP